jgi:hypothetical protein
MGLVIASAHLTDDEFLTAFTQCELPCAKFRHGDHLRLAWILLHRYSFDQALEQVRCGIRRYAAHYGLTHVFHETVTSAWVKLIATHHEATFNDFIRKNERRLTLGLLHRFWTPETLSSEAARLHWIPPDREDLPT